MLYVTMLYFRIIFYCKKQVRGPGHCLSSNDLKFKNEMLTIPCNGYSSLCESFAIIKNKTNYFVCACMQLPRCLRSKFVILFGFKCAPVGSTRRLER